MSVFDIALEKRFTDSDEIASIDVSSEDTLLIRDSATGVVMRVKFSTLVGAISSAFTGTFASLVDGKVPAAQLPSFVDDVLEYADTAAFPATGEAGKIYVALNTGKTYRWGGSAYAEISPSPGSTDSVPEGSVNLYHTTARAAAAAPVQSVAGRTGTVTLAKGDVGLANVDNTSDVNKPVSTAQQTALDGKASKAGDTFIDKVTVAKTSAGNEVILLSLENASADANTIVTIRLCPTSAPSIRYAAIQGVETGSNNVDVAVLTGAGASITEKMRVKASGEVCINQTSADGSGNKLQVNGGVSIAPSTTTTAPAAGGAGALPATPTGYATIRINGTDRKFPYY